MPVSLPTASTTGSAMMSLPRNWPLLVLATAYNHTRHTISICNQEALSILL